MLLAIAEDISSRTQGVHGHDGWPCSQWRIDLVGTLITSDLQAKRIL